MTTTRVFRLPVHVKALDLETPHSYLARLAAANMCDEQVMLATIRERRRETGRPDEFAIALEEWGGPPSWVWQRGHDLARANGLLGRGLFVREPRPRPICTRCAHGKAASARPHVRYNVCLKHRVWLGPGQATVPRQVVMADRRYRRVAATGLGHKTIELVWRTASTYLEMRTAGTIHSSLLRHPALAYPVAVRALTALADPTLQVLGADEGSRQVDVLAAVHDRLRLRAEPSWVLPELLTVLLMEPKRRRLGYVTQWRTDERLRESVQASSGPVRPERDGRGARP